MCFFYILYHFAPSNEPAVGGAIKLSSWLVLYFNESAHVVSADQAPQWPFQTGGGGGGGREMCRGNEWGIEGQTWLGLSELIYPCMYLKKKEGGGGGLKTPLCTSFVSKIDTTVFSFPSFSLPVSDQPSWCSQSRDIST